MNQQESSETYVGETNKKSAEPLISNESHNPLLEASLEKALEAEEASINTQTNFLMPSGKL